MVPDNIDAISGEIWTIIIVEHFYLTRRYVAKNPNDRKNQMLESGTTSQAILRVVYVGIWRSTDYEGAGIISTCLVGALTRSDKHGTQPIHWDAVQPSYRAPTLWDQICQDLQTSMLSSEYHVV